MTKSAGYRLEKVYMPEQRYSIIAETDEALANPTDDRSITLGWDWRPVGARRFDVVLAVRIGPAKGASEEVFVRAVGQFTADEGDLSVSFVDFLKTNAPAILFPFAREAVSTLTGRGPYGSFHLNPINVAAVLSGMDETKSSGYQMLRDDPEFATRFGIQVDSVGTATSAVSE